MGFCAFASAGSQHASQFLPGSIIKRKNLATFLAWEIRDRRRGDTLGANRAAGEEKGPLGLGANCIIPPRLSLPPHPTWTLNPTQPKGLDARGRETTVDWIKTGGTGPLSCSGATSATGGRTARPGPQLEWQDGKPSRRNKTQTVTGEAAAQPMVKTGRQSRQSRQLSHYITIARPKPHMHTMVSPEALVSDLLRLKEASSLELSHRTNH